jgi:hypothetical protein
MKNHSVASSLITEGGGHIVISTDLFSDVFDVKSLNQHFVIRIPKALHGKPANLAISDKSFCVSNLLFIDNNIRRWFPTYTVAACHLVDLPDSFTTSKLDVFRPLKRKSKPLHVMNVAYLEPNIFWFEETAQSASFCWEIKVKCDLRSISPFLQVVSFPKLYHSRYLLNQHYKQRAANSNNGMFRQVEWGKFRSRSSYHPADLCSNDFQRIFSAVENLVENPQNNLGIVYNENRCYGWDIDNIEEYESKLEEFASLQDAAPDNFPFAFDRRRKWKSLVNFLFSLILHEEMISSYVEKLQCLDIIDCEGAYECYRKGLASSSSQAGWDKDLLDYLQQPLQDSIKIISDIIYDLHYPSNNSHDRLERPSFQERVTLLPISSALKSYLLLVHDSKTMLLGDPCPKEFVARREQLRGKALELLNMYSLDDILYLLKLWMLSIIAKDCSVLVSIRWSTAFVKSVVGRKALNEILEEDTNVADLSDLFCVRKQQQDDYGHIKVKNSVGVEIENVFDYKINLVDIGLKDFSKFISKKKKDEEICQVFTDFVRRS